MVVQVADLQSPGGADHIADPHVAIRTVAVENQLASLQSGDVDHVDRRRRSRQQICRANDQK